MRWHVAHGTMGCGALYQGRFKSCPVQQDEHFLMVCRYVERNALTVGAVDRAEDWRWSSLLTHRQGDENIQALLSDWPIDQPRNWMRAINQPMSAKELERMRTCIERNRPFGNDTWQKRTANRLGLTASLRSEGQPKKITSQKNYVPVSKSRAIGATDGPTNFSKSCNRSRTRSSRVPTLQRM